MKKFRIISLVFLIAFVLMQFIRPSRNQSSDQGSIKKTVSIPSAVSAILKNACYDCHSNNTRYPWYSNIQPIGIFMAKHIREGKQELNFDEFNTYSSKRQRNKLKRMKEQIEKDEMPLPSYTWMHSNAKLTIDQKQLINKWIDSTLHR
ncbi:cytochrome C [Chitinophaga silvatica]|uniref:Cytochrome C n=2 Tax=Chitinophaga silvatica TaxID=2282649 RepID=A0A3E1Y472_9BACT|nr:heme-binding domain-containing protein [Chitinophaga silvatica]RFS19453.1 cytochrome C [Chitinophaga silvatica]